MALVAGLATVADVTPASATTLRATQGDVTATLTYQKVYPVAGNQGPPEARGAVVTITKAGRLVYRAGVASPVCGRLCYPEPTSGLGQGNALRVVRFGPGSPDVVLGLYSGGAHCCFVDQVFVPRSNDFYVKIEVDLGDPGARIETLPGNRFAAFVTADDSFAYAFTDFAASGLPLKILRLRGTRFVDVTRQYPSLLRRDARQWLAAFTAMASSHYQDSVGVIAAWTADEYLLGRVGDADAFLHEQAAQGHLRSLINPAMTGQEFITQLEKFLEHQGY